jgi:hypothetical protein
MPPRPKNAYEAQLEAAQKAVTLGQKADIERKRLLLKLWEGGMTQAELAERLTRASVAAGGKPVSENSVYKLLAVLRRSELEQEAS